MSYGSSPLPLCCSFQFLQSGHPYRSGFFRLSPHPVPLRRRRTLLRGLSTPTWLLQISLPLLPPTKVLRWPAIWLPPRLLTRAACSGQWVRFPCSCCFGELSSWHWGFLRIRRADGSSHRESLGAARLEGLARSVVRSF